MLAGMHDSGSAFAAVPATSVDAEKEKTRHHVHHLRIPDFFARIPNKAW